MIHEAILEHGFGEIIERIHAIHPLSAYSLPPINDESWYFVRFIDADGLTVFNNLQMPSFIVEWDRFGRWQSLDHEERAFHAEVRRLAERCRDEVFLFLRFVGD